LTDDDPLLRSLDCPRLPGNGRSFELLARARGGDEDALGELLRHHADRLQRIVRVQLSPALRRHCDSMDIVQDTFRAALPRLAEFDPHSEAGLLAWLSTIATNRVRDEYDRWNAAKRDVRREEPLLSPGAGAREPTAAATAPDLRAELDEVRELLDEEVARLPEDQRRVVLLRDYLGADWDEVVQDLGRSAPAARQLHQRAWIHLRRVLRPRLRPRSPSRE